MPHPTNERIWVSYIGCVTLVALLTPGGGMPKHEPVTFVLLHAAVLLWVLLCRWLAVHRGPAAARIPRAVLAVAGLPIVFSALCWLLPGVHPEPYEYDWLALDRWMCAGDVAQLSAGMPPWLVEAMFDQRPVRSPFSALGFITQSRALRVREHFRARFARRPRRHLVTYHGVLAPGASLRHRVVPQVDEAGEQEGLDEDCADSVEARSDEFAAGSVAQPVARVPHRSGKWRRAIRRYYKWAELLRRVFRVEIFKCPNCGGVRRLLAAIQDPSSIERVLRAMGLPFEAPELAVARAPPDGGGGWLDA